MSPGMGPGMGPAMGSAMDCAQSATVSDQRSRRRAATGSSAFTTAIPFTITLSVFFHSVANKINPGGRADAFNGRQSVDLMPTATAALSALYIFAVYAALGPAGHVVTIDPPERLTRVMWPYICLYTMRYRARLVRLPTAGDRFYRMHPLFCPMRMETDGQFN